jgi:exosortase/archaeosortase family protein
MTPVLAARDDRRAYPVLLAITGAILLALPFITTFNDFLTAGAIRLGIAGPIQAIGPLEARMVVGILTLFGMHAGVAGSQMVVWNLSGQAQNLFISWNCVGWQSLLLLGVSLVSGLRGHHSWLARIQVVLIGVLGTLCVNLVRITLVTLLAATAGRVPAIIFHDYGGTLLVIAWLFAFWALTYRWILGGEASAEAARVSPAA